MTRLEDLVAELRRGEPIPVAGALFDMDGTLVDSIPAVEGAWRLWAEEHHVPTPGADMHGKTARAVVIGSGLPPESHAAAEARLVEIEARPGQVLDPLPGARALIDALPTGRWGIVTSASRSVALARFAATGMPEPEFRITGSDVARSKPAPEPFRRGVDELRRRGHDGVVLAFEDTVAGAMSARDAGCLTIAVLGTADPAELETVAHLILGTLEQVHVTVVDSRVIVHVAPRPAHLPVDA